MADSLLTKYPVATTATGDTQIDTVKVAPELPAIRVRSKTGHVEWEGIHPAMHSALRITQGVFELLGKECVVTSAVRPEDPGSQHAEGKALDFRVYHLTLYKMQELRRRVATALGSSWDVVLEHHPPHLHLELDPSLS